MNLIDFPEAIKELKAIALSLNIGIDNEKVKQSQFYQLIQNARDLQASNLNLNYNEMILIIRLAAASSTLKTIDLRHSELSGHGTEVAKILSTSSSITKVDMRNNQLTEDEINSVTKIFKYHNSLVDVHHYPWFTNIHPFYEGEGLLKEICDFFMGHCETHIDYSI